MRAAAAARSSAARSGPIAKHLRCLRQPQRLARHVSSSHRAPAHPRRRLGPLDVSATGVASSAPPLLAPAAPAADADPRALRHGRAASCTSTQSCALGVRLERQQPIVHRVAALGAARDQRRSAAAVRAPARSRVRVVRRQHQAAARGSAHQRGTAAARSRARVRADRAARAACALPNRRPEPAAGITSQ